MAMTDQEFEGKLEHLMTQEMSQGKQKKKKRKRKFIIGAAAAAVALVILLRLSGGSGEMRMPVMTQPLVRGDIQEVLSISGPVSGTDSAEVVSNLHAEILEILVKEGDEVTSGQVLAYLDQTDAQRDVDIAQNSYDLAIANQAEAQRTAENGYAKAGQELQAAMREYQRKEILFASGDIAQTEIETARDQLENARRELTTYTIVNGKATANESYALQVKNAAFELEQKKKRLEETAVKSPIAGTVVRVNSRVGRFADMVDDDKPLFAIDNLEHLEMKINVSEYSVGKVKLGQAAVIRADILNGESEQGIITSISPTGEEKGGGSTERVIPTTIQIQNQNTALIAGITARAEIVLAEANDTWVVPISAVVEKEDGTYLATVEQDVVKLVSVSTGVESDIEIEISGLELTEGIFYIVTPEAGIEDGTAVSVMP